jgi:hypothetical protein
VNDTTDAAHQFDVGGVLFQFQRLVIEQLQQFLRGLEEELPHFHAALIGRVSHAVTSTFW